MNELMYSGEEVNQILFEVTLEKAKVEEKLKKIEQIVERFKSQYDHTSSLDLMVEIKEVLEQE